MNVANLVIGIALGYFVVPWAVRFVQEQRAG